MYANATILKIFVCHYNSETHNQMVNSIVTHTKNKIQAIEAIFDRYTTSQHVEMKHFCQQSMIFMNFAMIFSKWNINQVQEGYSLTRTKTYQQLNHENFLLGKELLWFLGEKDDVPYFIKIIQDKHYNDVFAALEKYKRKEETIEAKYKSITLQQLVDIPDFSVSDPIRTTIWKKANLPF